MLPSKCIDQTLSVIRGIWLAPITLALLLSVPSGSANATYLPSVVIGTAALISPTAADSYYGNGTTSTVGPGAPATRPPELVELARALKNNPDLIYEYVRNNIEVVWLYGLQKGALGASIDKTGTPFDQTMLMVELLRQAGFTATYQAGTITLSGSQFNDWTGITNATAACQLLASGGIPAIINGSTSATCSYSGNVTSLTFGHAWVKVNIPGSSCASNCLFDPSYKPHVWKTGINLITATGLVSGQPLSQATSGMGSGTTSGVSYVNNLNAGALNTKLQTYSSNYLSYLQSNNLQGAQMEDIVGGGVITPYVSPAGGLRQTLLPYTSSVQHSWSGNIPDQYRTTLEVKGMMRKYTTTTTYIDDTMFDTTFYADDIYGRALTIETNYVFGAVNTQADYNSNTIYLKADHITLATYVNTFPQGLGGTTRGLPGHVVLTVNHPYSAAANGSSSTTGDYMDEIADKAVVLITPLTIVHGWGDTGNALFTKWSDEHPTDTILPGSLGPPPNDCPGNEPCPNNYFGPNGDAHREKTAAAWMAQSTRAAQLHAAIAGAVAQTHHLIGVVYADAKLSTGYNLGAYGPPTYSLGDSFDRMDIDAGLSLTSKTADANARRAALQGIAASWAAIEGSISQQMSDVPDSASTATRFEWGNAPPSSEDPSAAGPRNFMQFTSSNASAADGLVLAENMVSTSFDGINTSGAGPQPTLDGADVSNFRTGLSVTISDYATAGFTVVASQESFLGPGQRGGMYDMFNQTHQYTAASSKQRGGAIVATLYNGNGDPVQIAHITTAFHHSDFPLATKGGGGGGVTPDNATQYSPSQAADILKSRFIDKSGLLGINLSNGSLSYTSPVTLTVGNGGFPYSLQAGLSWRPQPPPNEFLAPTIPTQPSPGFTTNWQNNFALSGSGMEAMGKSDVRAAAGVIAAFLAAQDIYKSAQSPQRDVAAVLTQSWWSHQLAGNVATVTVGTSTRQFVRLPGGTWIATGAGPYAALTQNGSRVAYQFLCPSTAFPPYAMSRGWDLSGTSFDVTGANGDVQHFDNWLNRYFTHGTQKCGQLKGYRLTGWTFPQGMTVNLVYGQPYDVNNVGGTSEIEQLIEVNNSLGRRIDFPNDGIGGITGYTNGLAGADARGVTFTGGGMTDPAGALTSFSFTIEQTASPTQRPVPYGQLFQVFTPDNPAQPNVQYDYDSLGRVKQVSDAVTLQVGGRNPYQFYIADGTRGERDDPSGAAYTVVYDTYGKPARYIDELARVTLASFDGRGRAASYTYPEGDCEVFGYDDHNNTTSYKRVDKASACNVNAGSSHVLSVSASWDQGWNKPLTIVNARGKTTTFVYYASGNGKSLLQTATRPDPDGGGPLAAPVYSFTYDAKGKLLTSTDPIGVVTSNAYDAGENLTSTVLDPGSSPHIAGTTSFTYDAQGDVATTTDPRNYVTGSVYDLDRRKTQDLHHDGNGSAVLNAATRTTYDLVGRVIKTEAGTVFSGTTVSTWLTTDTKTYTPTGKLATDMDGDNRVTTTAYDGLDRVLSVTDPVSRVTHFVYDAGGQTLIEQRAYGSALQEDYATYTYSNNGKQASVKDALGATHTTSFAYDGFDRLITTTFPDATYEALTYDEDGDVLTRRNRSNQTLTYTYDNIDRMLTKVSPSPALTVTWAYLGNGLIDKICDATNCGTSGNIIDYGYDTAGRLTSAATTIAGLSGAKTISYALDKSGNRTGLTWPDGYAVSYTYDSLNRMATAVNGSATLATYTYNPLSQRTNLAYNNAGGATVAYTWSTAGDLLTLTHNLSGTANDVTYTLAYTNAHQLASNAISNANYRYVPGANGTVAYAAANNLNQYPSVNSITQTYDTRGNLTGDGTWTYTYDAENRMLTAAKTGTSASYAYDPLGRRVKKTVGSTSTYYLSDGSNEITEYASNNTVSVRYVPGPAIDDPIAMVTSGGTTTYFHEDKTGSVVAMSGISGALTEGPYLYDSFGNVNLTTGVPYKFTGRRLDAETNLYYFRARCYLPSLGRFCQTDPVGYGPDLNLYPYPNNDPTDKTDPSGNCPTCFAGALIGAIIEGGDYLLNEDKPTVGGFIAHAGEGAVVGGLIGSGVGIEVVVAAGAGAHVGQELVTATSKHDLSRYGNSPSETAKTVVTDAAKGAASALAGGKIVRGAAPIVEKALKNVANSKSTAATDTARAALSGAAKRIGDIITHASAQLTQKMIDAYSEQNKQRGSCDYNNSQTSCH